MDFFEAILMGIIQGITEFLPISSTGHLTVVGKLMDLIESDRQWTSFIAVIQLGTLFSILFYFRKEIVQISYEFIKENILSRQKFESQGTNSKLGWMIIFGTIPVVVIGLLFKDVIEGALTKNLYVIASSLIVLAIILAIAELTAKFQKDIEDITIKDAIIIGLAQSVSLIPGSSRSGTTITGGLFTGLNREAAARFSFLLSIPAIFASGLLQLYQSLKYIDTQGLLNILVATFFSTVAGYLAIDFLLKYLKRRSTFVFIVYRIALGILILLLLSFDVIQP
ncbi:MAG: undecaprenyl-diphosphatase UppP [Ignavibacteriaceae bacterium]